MAFYHLLDEVPLRTKKYAQLGQKDFAFFALNIVSFVKPFNKFVFR